ncbi:hypothetical protein FE784_00615 [Paenibacillus hemerocallicola]|uniref:Uncharacterized protein n=1 Tax=Paenibacillus hemerocallicola TaxID=1172614 RepID=A0A5C4THC2_9BACL|nr:hypothetical protein FE784_00615 [Paenibacillus hemerocallicola]
MDTEKPERARSPAGQAPLNGMYYERKTDRFVSFVHGRRHYEIAARRCGLPKDWQDKTRRERAI